MRALLALIVAAVLSGCGATMAHPTTPSRPPSRHSSTVVARQPARGWAEQVVRAGPRSAYVVGAALGGLYRVYADGRVLRRASPGPAGPSDASPGFAHLAFDGPRRGLAIAGGAGHRRVDATTDGARSWRRVRLATTENPSSVAVGGGRAYALTSDCGTTRSACHHVTLWSIDSAGRARTDRSLPRVRNARATLAAFGPHVWVVVGLGDGLSRGFRSDDGGATWRGFDPGTCLWIAPVATSAHVLWSTCGTGMLEHFARSTGGPPVGVGTEVGGTTSSGLQAISDTTAVVIRAGGQPPATVYVTHDGGRHLTPVARLPRALARQNFETTYLTARVGYLALVGRNRLYRTVDGGRSWQPVSRP